MVRNLLALASGVTRTAFFDLWHDASDGDAPNTVLWGAFRLLGHDGVGALRRDLPLSRPLQRLATALAGATLARRIPVEADAEIYAFRVERKERVAPSLSTGWHLRRASSGDSLARRGQERDCH